MIGRSVSEEGERRGRETLGLSLTFPHLKSELGTILKSPALPRGKTFRKGSSKGLPLCGETELGSDGGEDLTFGQPDLGLLFEVPAPPVVPAAVTAEDLTSPVRVLTLLDIPPSETASAANVGRKPTRVSARRLLTADAGAAGPDRTAPCAVESSLDDDGKIVRVFDPVSEHAVELVTGVDVPSGAGLHLVPRVREANRLPFHDVFLRTEGKIVEGASEHEPLGQSKL